MRSFVLMVLLAAGCGTSAPESAPPVAEDPPAPREARDNPQYASWSTFPKGTVVVHRTVTRADKVEGETVTTTTYTLVDRTDENVVVEMETASRRYDGLETRNKPRSFTHPKQLLLPPGAKPGEPKEQGEETIRIGAKDHRTRWQKSKDRNEAGEVFTQVWTSTEVPGGLVKSVMQTPAIGATTTTELVEVRVP